MTACCSCKSTSVKNDKFSTFSDAAYTGNIEKMKQHLKNDAKNREKIVNEVAEDGMSPIHRAAQRGTPDVIGFLLDNKANVSSRTKTGETPLHIACFHRKRAAVERLLQQPDMIKLIDLQDKQHEMTALHVAIYRGAPKISELLLKAGANPDICDKYGNNALEMARFWVSQADAGLSSPTARHHQTLEVLLNIGKGGGVGSPTVSPSESGTTSSTPARTAAVAAA